MARFAAITLLFFFTVACSSTPVLERGDAQGVEVSSAEVTQALAYLKQHADRYRLNDPEKQLVFRSIKKDRLGFKHLYFQPVLAGVPFWRKRILVHLNRSGEVYRVSGKGAGLLSLSTEPRLSEAEIMPLALALMAEGEMRWKVKQSQLYIYLPWHNEATLVYEVELHRGLVRQFVLLDANSGQLVKRVEGSPSL
ncbi:MAG: hypothetical protein Q9N68_00385 [Gammaproteobacteria bacterium]|nr:hypothetical protein [Gammaproteobacteria bacterium]